MFKHSFMLQVVDTERCFRHFLSGCKTSSGTCSRFQPQIRHVPSFFFRPPWYSQIGVSKNGIKPTKQKKLPYSFLSANGLFPRATNVLEEPLGNLRSISLLNMSGNETAPGDRFWWTVHWLSYSLSDGNLWFISLNALHKAFVFAVC